jgi:hypothetical protein
MADMALFIGWGEPVRGREVRSVQVFGEAMAYWQRLQNQGEIESYEAVLLEPHGGDLGGFVLLRGDGDKLMRVWQSEEFDRLVARTRLIVENFGITPAIIGQRLQQGMAQYQEQAAELS